ncbi:hypothetical protein [Fontivita pretiosa]|uniref:hypothetical protein n=1 Tax=Fontivita pretiosa TaxID=2989684 RepID=UPI003D169359
MYPRITTVFIGFLVFCATAWADPRPFTFTYDTYPVGKGNFEYEQWVTYRTHTQEDSDLTRIDLRHEIEIGLADNFDLGLYLPNWRYEDTEDHTGPQFDSISAEFIYYPLNPVTDPIGMGLYMEVGVAEDELQFEPKLLLQKDINNWTFAYNLILETEIEGVFDTEHENEVEGVIGHAIGVSYGIAPGWQLGAELTIESEYADWEKYQGTVVYAGPAISYQRGTIPGTQAGWWVTVTPAFQLSDEEDQPDLAVRMIAGIEF